MTGVEIIESSGSGIDHGFDETAFYKDPQSALNQAFGQFKDPHEEVKKFMVPSKFSVANAASQQSTQYSLEHAGRSMRRDTGPHSVRNRTEAEFKADVKAVHRRVVEQAQQTGRSRLACLHSLHKSGQSMIPRDIWSILKREYAKDE